MSDPRRSSSELERDVEQTRSDVDMTMHELKDRFSAEGAIEYGTNYVRGPGGQRLLGAIRDNPIAAVLALAGIGWLLYTANRPESERRGTFGSGRMQPSGTKVADHARRRDAGGPGVMGDGTQEQNLTQAGQPNARISRQEVEAAFAQDPSLSDVNR